MIYSFPFSMAKANQISLFGENNGVVEIKKHSALVAMNNTLTTFQQSKAINALLYIVKDQLKRNPEQRRFTIPLWIIKRLGGIARNDNKDLKDALRGLVSLVIEYNILGKDKQARWAFPFLSLVHIEGNERGKTAMVTFEMASPILEAVKHPNMYANLDLLILHELCESKYAYLLYQLLKDYIKLGQKHLRIEEFRKLMGVPNWKYTIFTMLKKRVLETAVNAINEKTPMTVTFELRRKGRKVTEIIFQVAGEYKRITKQEVNTQITKNLKNFWLKDNQINFLLKKHDEDYILANIAVVQDQLKSGKPIRNVAAYLLKAFEVDFTVMEVKPLAEFEEKKATESKEKWALANLEATYKEEKKAALGLILKGLSEKETLELKEEFIDKILQTNFHADIFKAKWFEHGIIQTEWKKFIILRFLASDYHSFENYKAKNLKPQIDSF